ncbi:MAG: hypothetical protein NW207_11475 [Cytophagales bacterium]|nr:hypothetical protein [Cytophagales bacterium]
MKIKYKYLITYSLIFYVSTALFAQPGGGGDACPDPCNPYCPDYDPDFCQIPVANGAWYLILSGLALGSTYFYYIRKKITGH